MTTFYGNYEQMIDSKRRLPITAALRELIDPDRDGSSYSALIWPDGHMWLFPRKYYLRLIGASRENSSSSAEHAAAAKRFNEACTLKPDAQGRVVLSEKLISDAHLSEEVVLRGIDDHIEVWPVEEWRASAVEVDLADLNEVKFRAAQQLAREDREAAGKKQ